MLTQKLSVELQVTKVRRLKMSHISPMETPYDSDEIIRHKYHVVWIPQHSHIRTDEKWRYHLELRFKDSLLKTETPHSRCTSRGFKWAVTSTRQLIITEQASRWKEQRGIKNAPGLRDEKRVWSCRADCYLQISGDWKDRSSSMSTVSQLQLSWRPFLQADSKKATWIK